MELGGETGRNTGTRSCDRSPPDGCSAEQGSFLAIAGIVVFVRVNGDGAGGTDQALSTTQFHLPVTPGQHKKPCSNTGSPSSTCDLGWGRLIMKLWKIGPRRGAQPLVSDWFLPESDFSPPLPRGNWCYWWNYRGFSRVKGELGGGTGGTGWR